MWHGGGPHRPVAHAAGENETPDRTAEGPVRILAGYAGYLQTDADSAYERLFADGTILEVGYVE
jgi:hypothetical protein